MIFYNVRISAILNFVQTIVQKMKSILKYGFNLSAALLVGVLSFSQAQTNHSVTNSKEYSNMETIHANKNKEIIRSLYENILNNGKLEKLREIISEDYTGVRGEKGTAGFAQTVGSLRAGFPDIKWTIEDLIADGDKVVVRWSWKGTNKGLFRGFPPNNKEINDTAIAIYQFKGDKVSQAWIQSDRLGFLMQLGVVSPDVLIPPINKKTDGNYVRFIDKFFVPANSKKEFIERMSYNRNFLKTLPGFIKDEAFQQTDANGNLTVITVTCWENEEAIKKAKESVQAEYKRIGFNLPEMMERLHITLERGIYQEMTN